MDLAPFKVGEDQQALHFELLDAVVEVEEELFDPLVRKLAEVLDRRGAVASGLHVVTG